MYSREHERARLFAHNSMGGLLSRLAARNVRLPFMAAPKIDLSPNLVKCDIPQPWRYDWGGQNPASPQAEMMINYHNALFGMMLGINVFVIWLLRARKGWF